MHIFCLLGKVSVRYWGKHRKRIGIFLLTIMMGAAALSSVALLFRSYKEMKLEDELNLLGDYDAIVYNLEQDQLETFKQEKHVSAIGDYAELGYAKSSENEKKVKVACFEDKTSEKLYHMNCSQGRYPVGEREIAIDVKTAKLMGITPVTGSKVDLSIYDFDEKKIVKEEFVISGIFHASDESSYGGWYRYPEGKEIDSYDMPGIFVSDTYKDSFENTVAAAFVQADGLDEDDMYDYFEEKVEYEDISVVNGRKYAYSYILGIVDTLYQEYGGLSIKNIRKAMQNGNVVKDIYSGVIIPLFGFLIFLIAFFSIYGIVKGILNEKREEIAIIRSMGVNARATVVWLFLEFVIIALLGSLLGILLGVGIHELMTGVLNRFENLNIHSAFSASEYVKAVTVSPFLYTLLIVLLAVCLASLPLIYSFIKNTPTELLQNKTAHRKRKREKQSGKRKTWFCVLNRRIRLFDGSICVSAMIIVSVTVLGYLFFCALSELDQSEIDSAMMDMETDTGSYDYMAETTNSERMYTFHIENGHDSGIDKESYVDLKNNHAVEEIHAQIRNMSTRISYRKKALQSAKKNFLEEYSLREHSSFDTDFEQQLSLAEEAMITAIGYDKDDGIYSTPTIGMTEEDIGELEPALSCGNINEAALREGSEVILAVPEEKLEECLNYFQVGENIPMSDIVLSDEEEKYDFSSLLPANVTSPVYKKNVVTDDGDHVELTSYAFGKRKNITAQIGAIVGITEENEKFFPQMSEYMGADYEGYGICIVCGVDAFTNWGLPDRLFTNLSVTLKEDADVDAFDSAWYQQLAQCKGISYLSLKENYDEKQEIEKKNMTVFYMLLVMIAVYGFIAVLIAMYNKHRLKSQEFAYLKSVGLSNGQMLRLILYKNVVYPLAGMVFAPIPVAACQMFFDYIRKNVDSGTWDSLAENINEIPWYHYVPFRYHLYNIHFFTSLLAGTGIVLLIVSVASLSGIRYLIRQNIAEEFEINHF